MTEPLNKPYTLKISNNPEEALRQVLIDAINRQHAKILELEERIKKLENRQ